MEDKFSINNRRYLGSKYKLISTIKEIVENNCDNVQSVAELFAGTGVVSSLFFGKQIITNDLLYSNYLCNYAWFGPTTYRKRKISSLIKYYNTTEVNEDNYVSINFGGKYFSINDCRRIGFIREDIERRFIEHEINERERAVLITSLLYAMDKIANTCGHYDAFIQGKNLSDALQLRALDAPSRNRKINICFNEDASEVARKIKTDLVYLDPPYNSRQYCDAYHLLENIAKWDQPEVFGVAGKMDRTSLKSDYCTKMAPLAMDRLIDSLNCRYILLSYNNMAEKGNARSNARITDEELLNSLSKRGDVTIFSQDHRAFSTGKSDIQDNQERLFLCKVNPR